MDWRSRLSSFRRTRAVWLLLPDNMGASAPFSLAIMNTTIPTETELSSVNSILMALGQAPINRIFNDENGQLVYVNPEVALCHSLLLEVNTDVQNEGWVFNRRTLPIDTLKLMVLSLCLMLSCVWMSGRMTSIVHLT